MAARLRAPIVLVVLLLVAALGAERAAAATTLGSLDPTVAPDRYWNSTRTDRDLGLRQFALDGALVTAPEAGVLVSARAYAKRIAGTEPARVAVLRPVAGGIGATIVATAPLPVTSRAGALSPVENLHLAVEPGDSLALLFRPGQVDLGVRDRPRPDGAVVSFSPPCTLCGDDAGTGRELLFDGTIEPDADSDLLGDETQDPDAGGLELPAEDEDDSSFEYGFGDESFDEGSPSAEPRAKRLRLIKVTRRRAGGVSLLLAIPKAGRVIAIARVATSGPKKAAGHRVTIASARMRVRQARRVRLELALSRSGRRLLEHRGPLRAAVGVTFRPISGRLQALSKQVKLVAAPRPHRPSGPS